MINRVKFPPEPWVKRAQELQAIKNYDGQGKSRQQETDGGIAVAGLFIMLAFGVAWAVLLAVFVAVVGW